MPIDLQTIQSAQTAGDAAAMWWTSILRDPKLDNGDDSPMMAVITTLSKEHHPAQPEDGLELFFLHLSGYLNDKLGEMNPDSYEVRYGIGLSVDYHPDQVLAECATVAGLRLGISDWPWKTHMTVKPDEVSVSYGYRAQPEVVWTKQS